MKVTFADFGPNLASARLRAKIPQRELAKMGIKKGNDVLIYGKHWLTDGVLEGFKKLIYDVCDDHFKNKERGAYYLRHTLMADVVTCNSEVMKQRIFEETGRHAVIIKEPYESDEKAPKIGPNLLWFGHKLNLVDLERIRYKLTQPLTILSNHPDHPKWTPETYQSEIAKDCIVIIPTGKSLAKSENRMVESIRNGKYVCAEHLPSYEQLNAFPLGDIPSHIDWVLSNTEQAIERIKAAQSLIRDTYSPRTIAEQWLEVLNELG
jgi:hypothetical protein